ncbi:hypothetical protein HA050_03680 [Iodobacter sp. HSC-16F04]|uniref:Uncharacterized protein n=1 Tax=Iodobacter violaceini TaxID=3044271 RepID=A0ABX0KLT8_9NEIS|nr:hemagglutinin repeat-containing protein [Iodobacter violacea]NHQ85211.1 hypothetical protein [Iodobacter violacea]
MPCCRPAKNSIDAAKTAAADPKSVTYGESKSDGDINLQSALDESEQHSKNSSSSWGAGVAITMAKAAPAMALRPTAA